MERPKPIIVAHLFPELLEGLLGLLSGLSAEEWEMPTACGSWSVKGVALHLLGVEAGNLSRRRDGFSPPAGKVSDPGGLVSLVNRLNEAWVDAARWISPRLLCDLLRLTGEQACDFFRSLDPHRPGKPVSWAGPDSAPVWLDIAREYTERWHHQQHIRDAVGKPGFTEPRFFAPVLDAFVRGLPHAFRQVDAVDGSVVTLTISGESGGQWSLRRDTGRWNLYIGTSPKPHSRVIVDQDVAWRLFTKGLDPEQARATTTIQGEQALGLKVLSMVSIIA